MVFVWVGRRRSLLDLFMLNYLVIFVLLNLVMLLALVIGWRRVVLLDIGLLDIGLVDFVMLLYLVSLVVLGLLGLDVFSLLDFYVFGLLGLDAIIIMFGLLLRLAR